MAYPEMGYLPDAFFNFLALLGWSPGDNREILSRQDLIELFSLEGVGKANAVFGTEKLNWFNGQYITKLVPDDLRNLVGAELHRAQVWTCPADEIDAATMDRTLALIKSRTRVLGDFSGPLRAFFTDRFEYDPAATAKFLNDPQLPALLPVLAGRYEADAAFTLESTEKILRDFAQERGLKAGLLINALRVGLTGQGVAPGLFDVMLALGRERTLERMHRLARFFGANHSATVN
jgi:glutamyl-tRNA synthetase